MSRNKHLKEHAELGYPEVDSDGNLLAEVTPRTDTLANLLAITDAGDGEVATATDEDALVVYRGDPVSKGRPYYRGGPAALANASLASVNIGNVSQPVELSGSNESPVGIIDSVNDEFLLPPSVAESSGSDIMLLEIDYSMVLFTLSAGAVATVRAQWFNDLTTIWNNFTTPGVQGTTTAAGTCALYGSEVAMVPAGQVDNATKVRVTIQQDGAILTGDIFQGTAVFRATIKGNF